jgi:O-antigen/teichoic acid export membrane protein
MRWAGQDKSFIANEMGMALRFLICEQVVIVIFSSLLAYFILPLPLNWLWLMIFLFAFIMNMTSLFTFAAQAVKIFTMLSIVNICRNILFLIILAALFLLNNFNYQYVIYANIIVFSLALLTLVLWFRKYLRKETFTLSHLLSYGFKNINVGIYILLGNFIVVVFFTIDKLMVSNFYSINEFAIYAFASSIVITIYFFVKAISDVVFPYLANTNLAQRSHAYRLGGIIIILIWGIVLTGYFPLAWFIELFLPNYIASLPFIQILLCSIVFGSIIQILHVNYYRTHNKQRQYFLFGFVALVFAILLCFLAIKIWVDLRIVAVAMLFSCFLWYLINEFSLKQFITIKSLDTGKSIAAIFSYIAAFWLLTILCRNIFAQIGLYLFSFLFFSWLLFRHEIKELLLVIYHVRKMRIIE